jgi:hypothetical protein
MTFMESRFLDVEDHLCTPQGQRTCFPGGVDRAVETQLPSSAPTRDSGKTGRR